MKKKKAGNEKTVSFLMKRINQKVAHIKAEKRRLAILRGLLEEQKELVK